MAIKLARYRLGREDWGPLPEVWFWQDGVFSLYRLQGVEYETVDCSKIPELVELDIKLLSRCVLMAQTSRLEAANAFRQGIRA